MNSMVLTAYNQTLLDSKPLGDIKELHANEEVLQWLHIYDFQEPIINDLKNRYQLEEHIIENLTDIEERPSFENHGNYLFITLKFNYYSSEKTLEEFQLGVLLFERLLITLGHGCEGHPFDPTKVLRDGHSVQKYDLEYLLHLIIDDMLDVEFDTLETLELDIDDLEDDVLATPSEHELHRIYNIKKDLIFIRKTLWPNQNVLRNLQYTPDFIDRADQYFYQDINNRVAQAIELAETYREICSGMLDTYLSSVSNRTNDIMKVLTIFATIFSPLSFLTGLYGMNFEYFPELGWRYAYVYFWLASGIITVAMLWYFKKKGWIGNEKNE